MVLNSWYLYRSQNPASGATTADGSVGAKLNLPNPNDQFLTVAESYAVVTPPGKGSANHSPWAPPTRCRD